MFNSSIFNNAIFNTGTVDSPPLGGKGDNKRTIFKPTGLVDRPKKKAVTVEPVVEIPLVEVPVMPIESMSMEQIEREIGQILRKKLRTQEEEMLLLIFMAAGSC